MRTSRRTDPTVELLRRLDLFRGCSDRELARAAGLVHEMDVPTGAVLCQQDHLGQHVYVIVEGEAAVAVDGEVVATVGPGEIVGEMSALDERIRAATVTATTPLVVLVATTRDFRELLTIAPAAGWAVLVAMSARLRRANSVVAR